MSNRILTINREFESAGNEIAQAVAERLDIPYYDRFLITAAAEDHGISLEAAEKNDERMASRFQYSEAQAAYYYTSSKSPLPTSAQLATTQFDLIKKIADEGPCVIVGRCAGNILREAGKDVVSVYIHASVEQRTKRAMENLKLSEAEAAKVLKKTDKARKDYHKHYTGKEWTDMDQYNMVLNSDYESFDTCVELICALYNA